MGVKTTLSLETLQTLFLHHDFRQITPTREGIIDTTYFVSSNTETFILKRFEDANPEEVLQEQQLLRRLQQCGLKVSQHLESKKEWHLYTKLSGSMLKHPTPLQLQHLGKDIAKMHQCLQGTLGLQAMMTPQQRDQMLQQVKNKNYALYKSVSPLQTLELKAEVLVHGDLFRDNVLFEGNHVGIIDFIDAGSATRLFDLGVAALSFASSSRAELGLFLKAYNQNTIQKISLPVLCSAIKDAARFYTLKRTTAGVRDYRHQQALLKQLRRLPC